MFRYVPIIKAKPGEFAALRNTYGSTKRVIAPLLELVPPPPAIPDKKTGKVSQPRPLSAQLRSHAKNIKESWQYDTLPVFIDGNRMAMSGVALKSLTAALPDHTLVPVLGITSESSYIDAVAELVKANPQRGACYRVRMGDPISQPRHFADLVSLNPDKIDIVFDLEYVIDDSDNLAKDIAVWINSLPDVGAWRSVTLAGGSFPVSLAKQNLGETSLPRLEWSLYCKTNSLASLARKVDYGDYGIQNPGRPASGHSGNANIRYTQNTRWVIYRGERIDFGNDTKNLTALMKPLCIMAASSPEFEGKDFCWADEHIADCAGRSIPENDHPTWKAVGFNHHITHAVRQLHAETSVPT
jgi:hypothetical protein